MQPSNFPLIQKNAIKEDYLAWNSKDLKRVIWYKEDLFLLFHAFYSPTKSLTTDFHKTFNKQLEVLYTTKKENTADIEQYNLLLLFSFYYVNVRMDRERVLKTAEMHTQGRDMNLHRTTSSFSVSEAGTGLPHSIDSSFSSILFSCEFGIEPSQGIESF